MRFGKFSALITSLVVVLMAGCGGGGGGGGSFFGGGSTPSGVVMSGTATKGPIAGGTVKAFSVISSARYSSTPLAQTTTAADGSYSLKLPVGFTKGSVMVEITGGSYTDESTGAGVQLASQYPGGMRAVFGNISGIVKRGEALNVSVTPYTELACEDVGHNLNDDSIRASNNKVAAAFGLPDILKVKPVDANKVFPAGASDDAKKYAFGLATISEYQKEFGAGATLEQITAALLAQLAGGGISPATLTQFAAAGNNYAGGSHNQNPELENSLRNAGAPTAIHTTPAAPVSVSIGSSQAISAHVVKADGNAVADGTLVSFSTTFGTLSAASVATVNGFANTSLTSATVGSAQVTVKSGNVTDLAAGISFVDPNAPASITLTAGASTGVTTGAPVALSASVTRAAGGPVPDGTAVSFQIISGSGTLSGATATSGGVATVNLTSSVAGASVTVKATAGGVSQTVSVPFIAQPTQAVVKVRTTGTLAGALIGGINATVNYSTGKGLSIVPAGVATSGVAIGSTLIPNTNNNGKVVLGLLNVGGIPLGEFATLTFSIAAGNFPTAADFSIAPGASAIDVTTATIPGVSADLSVTIQ